jgi:selT/selW/selH-like putative selenoprotein
LQLKKYIEFKAPEIDITGGEFPPGSGRQLAAKLVGFAQMGFIGIVVAGDTLFQTIGQPVPEFYEKIRANKWAFGMGAWFLGNTFNQNLLSTGAFEIYVNENLEFSKLNSG